MFNLKKSTFAFLLFHTIAIHAGGTDSPVGRWKTFDDETGKAKSIIRVYEDKGVLLGKIDSLLPWPGKSPDRVCEACTDDRNGKPIRGMMVMWDLHAKGSTWENGRILDPASGKIYRCRIALDPGGKSLTVRGFIGISLLGRSQKWERVE